MDGELADLLRTRFQALDGNGDLYLTEEDFDEEVARILRATDVPDSVPRARLLRSAYHAYWWALLDALDRDDDGKISFAEYLRIVDELDKFRTFARARADALDRLADLAGDGWITYDAFMAVMLAARFDKKAAEDAYDAMEDPAGGRIAAGRLGDAVMEFYETIEAAVDTRHLTPARQPTVRHWRSGALTNDAAAERAPHSSAK